MTEDFEKKAGQGSREMQDTPGTLETKNAEPPRDVDARYFTRIFNRSPIGIYIVQDGMFKFVNPEFQRTAALREEELLDRESLSIVYHEDREMVRENAKQMLKGKRTAPYVHRTLDAKGDMHWIIESVTSIQYGGKRATLGYFMDNTPGELARQALAASEEKFEKAFRSSPDWFVISTLEDGFYVDVNDTFLESTGYTREEVIGRTSKELGIWSDERDRERMVEILREKGEVRNLEVRFRMKSGDIRTVLWSAEVIEYGDEKCLLALTRDITARKRAEQERLEREKLQGVLETAGAACHELNQPLQHMFYLLDEVMEEHPDSESARELRQLCNRMREITRKLEGITAYESTDYVGASRIVDIDKAFELGKKKAGA